MIRRGELDEQESVDEHIFPRNFGLDAISDLGLIRSASTNPVVEADEAASEASGWRLLNE